MKLHPTALNDLCAALVSAQRDAQKIESVDLSALNRILEHTPEDMTVTIEAGITLEAMQSELARQKQWLPIDPPDAKASLGTILANNESGPRRFGYGTIRDYVIGLKVVMADGSVVKSGGKVVKNVAGYDLQKLFIGGQGTLGVIVEANFKLRPIPESEQFVQQRCASLDAANAAIEAVLNSELTPVVMDLHNWFRVSFGVLPSGGARPEPPEGGTPNFGSQKDEVVFVLGFDGTSEDVDWQLSKAKELGFSEPAKLNYDQAFRANKTSLQKISVLPSKLAETIRGLNTPPFVARAGNGIIYYRSETEPPKAKTPSHLSKRVKDAYDPKHIFPDLTDA